MKMKMKFLQLWVVALFAGGTVKWDKNAQELRNEKCFKLFDLFINFLLF